MGKYSTLSRREPIGSRKKNLPPILRGVGFAMMILIPLISYAATETLLNYNSQNHWITIPSELIIKSNFFPRLLLVKGILTLAIAVALYAIFMLITFLVYRIFGPPLYGPYDAPGVSYRNRRK
jgi:hypothetical protein